MPRPASPNTEIRALTESFASELEAIVKRMALEEVLAAIGGGAAPAPRRRGPGRPKGSKNKPKRGRPG